MKTTAALDAYCPVAIFMMSCCKLVAAVSAACLASSTKAYNIKGCLMALWLRYHACTVQAAASCCCAGAESTTAQAGSH